MDRPVLAVDDLKTWFHTRDGIVRAVDGVSFSLARGEMLGVVGESGCGKSITALSVMGLLQAPAGRIAGGSIKLNGRELVGLDESSMRRIRGNEISMIFQEPMTSLNPVMKIGKQIAEPLLLHQGMDRRAARAHAIEMLDIVHIPEARRRIDEYPHQLSGGMRQRVMIAIALACRPAVLIADEPTTALDVTIQAQILRLMSELQRELGTAIILITHDLGVIAESVERVVVMYAGRKVEEAPVEELFRHPRHPYTVGLLGSVPRVDRAITAQRVRLAEIPGMVPSPIESITGCRFAARCRLASEQCRAADPPLEENAAGHVAACWHSDRAMELAHV
jgi:oligopeptide/dipeptide ABC transporter ATP-binding protein